MVRLNPYMVRSKPYKVRFDDYGTIEYMVCNEKDVRFVDSLENIFYIIISAEHKNRCFIIYLLNVWMFEGIML